MDAVIGSLYALHLLYTRFPASTAPLQRVDILPRYNAVCALALTQAAKHLMLNSSGISAFSQRRTCARAGSGVLPRQMLRRRLLGLPFHPLPSRVRGPGRGLRVPRPGAPRRSLVQRGRVHRRRERHCRFQVLGFAPDHLVVRPSPVGLPYAAGPRELPGLPARPGLLQPQILRSDLHLLHQLPGLHRFHALRIQHRAGCRAHPLGQHRGRRALRQPGGRGGDGRTGHEADAGDRIDPGPGVHSQV